MRRCVLVGLALLGACYRPAGERACQVTCASHGARLCPGSLVCGTDDNLCHAMDGACGGDGDAGVADAPDASPDAPAALCLGGAPGLIKVCLSTLPTGLTSLGTTINTDTDAGCLHLPQSPGTGDPVCVIVAATIQQSGGVTTRVVGSQPLVLVATDQITIGGVLDAAAHRTDPTRPAGSRMCRNTRADPAGGGAGGTFGRSGGSGGGGINGSGGFSTGNGAAQAGPHPTLIEGGCDGDDGGDGNEQGNNSHGGRGGGAVYLLSPVVVVNGTINASGAGATGDGTYTGGGGGGAGGMIGIDAPSLAISGKVCANGGSGAAAGDKASGGVVAGDDPDPQTPMMAAPGRTSSSNGGNGGSGGVLALSGSAGGTGTNFGGGGGGGGGVGWFLVTSMPGGSDTISPPPKLLP